MAQYARVSKTMLRKLKYIEQGIEYYFYGDRTIKALMDRGLIYIDGDSETDPDEGPLLRLTDVGRKALSK
ncbi:hypothetical protein [Teredinibacter purpureus]|uniref:hypothetical protein n=1 Tax=Teredinibacter purpureus TaxID=2731756 RepID=UPI0005F80145|nr:hypothetical protein [Teredinibacter purpureus]